MDGCKLKHRKTRALLGLALCFMTSAYATDLLDAYWLGIRQDPTYNAAVANYLTEKEASPQARSAIFTQIESNADLGHLHRELANGSGGQTNLETYNFGVNLSQVLFDGRVFDRISEARSTVKQAAYILAAAKQDFNGTRCASLL